MRHLFTILAVVALAGMPGPQGTASRSLILSGPVAGIWELPVSGPGSVQGALLSVDGSLRLLDFQATLLEVGNPCLSCIEGRIDGILDDGVGPGPDFVVRGSYFGTFFGTGSYGARVFRPGGATPVGRIEGRFADAFGAGQGSFAGRFRLQR